MATVTEDVRALLGPPSRPAPAHDFSTEASTVDDRTNEMFWEGTVTETGAGWFLDDFVYLFGEGLAALAPCVEAWAKLHTGSLDGYAWRVVGSNAYGAILVHVGPNLGGGSLYVLDPTVLRFWGAGSGSFYQCLYEGFVKKGLAHFLESGLYAHWRKKSGKSLGLGEMLALRPAADLGRVLRPDDVEVVDAVTYYRATAKAMNALASNDPKKAYPPSRRNFPEVYTTLVHKKVPAALAAALRDPAKVTYLDLSSQNLDELPPEIALLSELGHCELKSNQLTALPPEIGRLKKLHRLNLNGNALRALPDAFCELTRLDWLGLEHNELASLPEAFGRLDRLSALWLEGNKLETLPESFGDLASLRWLNLSKNRLRALPDSMAKLTSLKELELQGNRLTEVPTWLHELPELDFAEVRMNPELKAAASRKTAGKARVLTTTVGPVQRLRRAAAKPRSTAVSRIGGPPIGVTARTWPKHEGKPMVHVLTIDLKAIGARIPRSPRARALAVFVPSKVEAWDAAEHARVVLLSDAAVKKGLAPLPTGLTAKGLLAPATLALEPVEGDEADDDEGLATLGPFAGGKPAWIQTHDDPDDPEAVFVMQIDQSIVPDLDLTPGGVMYVFDCAICFQR